MSKNTADQVAYKKQLEADEKKLDAEIASITAKIKAEEASGVTPSNRYDGGTFKWPTTSTRITSPYGDTSDRTSPHKGVDIGAVRAGVSGDLYMQLMTVKLFCTQTERILLNSG